MSLKGSIIKVYYSICSVNFCADERQQAEMHYFLKIKNLFALARTTGSLGEAGQCQKYLSVEFV